MPRMHILTAAEHDAFNTPPLFSYAERETFFHVSESLDALLRTLRSPTNRVYLVLTVGYFRATKRFFAPPFHQADVVYVARKLGYGPDQIDLEAYDAKATTSRHRKLTLDYLGFRPFNIQARQEMAQEIRTMIRSQMRPKAIFLRMLELLETHKTEIPSVHALTDLITQESLRHKCELTETIEAHLSPAHRELLDALLDKQEALWQPEPQVQRFKLTLLKRFSQSAKPAKIKANIEDLRILRPLYHAVEPVVAALDLTPEGVRYYANAVLKSRIFQVSRRAEDDRHLHLVCFIAHQFLRLHDVLIDVLLAVQSALNVCQREHKERYYAARIDQRQSIQALVESVSQGVFNPLAEIETIAFCEQLSDAEKMRHIQAVLSQGQEQRRAVEAHLKQVQQQSQGGIEDADYYEVLASKSIKLQNRVADIVKELEFQGDDNAALLTAIQHCQHKSGAISQTAPMGFLSDEEQDVLVDASGKFRVSLYKLVVHQDCRGYQSRDVESEALLQIPVVGRLPDPQSRVGNQSERLFPTGGSDGGRQLPTDRPYISSTVRPAVSSNQSAHRAGCESALSSPQGRLIPPLHTEDADGGQRSAAPPPAQPPLHLAGGSAFDRQPAHRLSRRL
jgi:hypothetical protein